MKKDKIVGRLMIVPVILVILLFEIYPVYKIIEFSLFRQNLLADERTFVWFENFITLFKTAEFWASLKNSFVYTFGVVAMELVVGLLVAMLIHQKFPGRNIARSMVLFSYIIPTVVVAIVFKFMLTGDTAIINYFLRDILHLNTPTAWFSNPKTAMLAVIIVGTWKHFPFMVIVFLAQLQSINLELYDAIKVDGANNLQEFRFITLPFLMPVILMALIFRTIFEFKYFDLIYLITQGGPLNATRVVPIYIYNLTFEQLSLGRGAAVAVIMFIITLLSSVIYIRYFERASQRLT